MTEYRISGVWKDSNDIITHYAFHEVTSKTVSRAQKKSKSDAIALLKKSGNIASTWLWNYKASKWEIGEKVTVIDDLKGKYLRSNPDNKLTDNLAHLIDFDWIIN